MYAFTSLSGTFDDRFELRFTNETLSLNPIFNTKNSILCYANDSDIVIKSKDIHIQSIMIFDGSGRLLFDKNKLGISEIIISDVTKNNQLLLVQVETEDGIKSTQKIIF
ncbi:T9SS sorting signal type C domain-containing protein [uncultured Flavobacterium sp.]|uniref:T9SS sorting signal type C domain-containing protein n=2 Tax=Flavobacterium TaxID=237 RepID=UPI00261EC155|nr:T9SS sorting signal type C domain-containing protein [uncultured Flavobacterium sp.]